MSITYPLDLTGTSVENFVKEELHTVNEAHFRDYFFLVPNFAPFFVDNFRAEIIVNGVSRDLVEDVDFSFALSYVTGTRTTGKNMYGAITLHNLEMNGIIRINYQTVGGDQTADKLQVLTTLADKAYNPRTTIWDLVTEVPNAFPPMPHYQDYDTFFGQGAVVEELQNIAIAIADNSSLTRDSLVAFLESIGMGSVLSFVKRTGDEMTGPLILSRDPELPLEAVGKQYLELNFLDKAAYQQDVSSFVKQQDLGVLLDSKVSLTGGEMTGPLILNTEPVQDLQAVNKKYVDDYIAAMENELNDLRSQVNSLTTSSITRAEVESMIGEVMIRMLDRPG